MADIEGGPITVGGVQYTVILRPAGAPGAGQGGPLGLFPNPPGFFNNNINNNAGAAAGAEGAPPANAGPGAGAEGNAMMGGKRSKKQKKGTRKLSPYMKFAQEARKKIIAEEPELKSDIIKVGKRIGEMWRGLSESEKAKY